MCTFKTNLICGYSFKGEQQSWNCSTHVFKNILILTSNLCSCNVCNYFSFIVFNVYSFKDDPNLMYKFNSELNKNSPINKAKLHLTDDHIDRTRENSTSSSVISSLSSDPDTPLEDCFEILAQLAPEALICASLTKRCSIRALLKYKWSCVHTCVIIMGCTYWVLLILLQPWATYRRRYWLYLWGNDEHQSIFSFFSDRK